MVKTAHFMLWMFYDNKKNEKNKKRSGYISLTAIVCGSRAVRVPLEQRGGLPRNGHIQGSLMPLPALGRGTGGHFLHYWSRPLHVSSSFLILTHTCVLIQTEFRSRDLRESLSKSPVLCLETHPQLEHPWR